MLILGPNFICDVVPRIWGDDAMRRHVDLRINQIMSVRTIITPKIHKKEISNKRDIIARIMAIATMIKKRGIIVGLH